MTFASEFVPSAGRDVDTFKTGNGRYTGRIAAEGRWRVGRYKVFSGVYVACVNKTFCGIFRTGINEQKGMETIRYRNNKTEIYTRASVCVCVCAQRGSILRRVCHPALFVHP